MTDQMKLEHGGIGWCRYTSNPLRARNKKTGKMGWSCIKINPLCTFCYSASLNNRWGTQDDFTKPGMEAVEHVLDEIELGRWLALQERIERKGHFCSHCSHQKADHTTDLGEGSFGCDKCECDAFQSGPCFMFPFDMTDWFGEWVPFEWLDKIFAHMALCPDVIFQTLTKRPARAVEYFNHINDLGTTKHRVGSLMRVIDPKRKQKYLPYMTQGFPGWPLPNVHFGVSAGTTATCEQLISLLRKVPAVMHWVSVEPLLDSCERGYAGSGNSAILCGHCGEHGRVLSPDAFGTPAKDRTPEMYFACPVCDGVKIGGVVIGCESGASRRPMKWEWAERIAKDCKAAGVKVWMKQGGDPVSKEFEDFPPSLRVREWSKR